MPQRRGWHRIAQRDKHRSHRAAALQRKRERFPPAGTGNTRPVQQNGGPHGSVLLKMATSRRVKNTALRSSGPQSEPQVHDHAEISRDETSLEPAAPFESQCKVSNPVSWLSGFAQPQLLTLTQATGNDGVIYTYKNIFLKIGTYS
ncbi:Hypothetical predicted protein [Marmota monax]|uniref:Uncharacterized protein n=1 Tax=Marmota monax TaxID=9995 RepID=A0A5E4CZB5_MARMO|nr:Hypothetical predicted protein [Marmota monax]